MSRSAAATAATAPAASTREAILDAAERGFAGRGYAASSMREIAAAAGLRNQASIYHHFADKRALYEAVLKRGIVSITEFVREGEPRLGRRNDARTRAVVIDATIDRVFDYLLEHRHLARLIQRASLGESVMLLGAAAPLLRPLYAQGLRTLSDAGASWRAAERPHLAAGLYHLIFGYFSSAPLLQAVLGEDPLSPQAIARQRRFLKTAVQSLLGVDPPSPAKITSLNRRGAETQRKRG